MWVFLVGEGRRVGWGFVSSVGFRILILFSFFVGGGGFLVVIYVGDARLGGYGTYVVRYV